MYRFYIDIPLSGKSEEEAKKISEVVLELINNPDVLRENGIEVVNYRLGHDDDRQRSNYFIKNENGHVSNKKSKICLTSDQSSVE